eukprot:6476977-Alexandrium_andersonii.AAC.1
MCAKLNHSLRGARAAPAQWEALCTATLQGLGFVRGKASACCFPTPIEISVAWCTGMISPSRAMTLI